jgi:hypothetical protein
MSPVPTLLAATLLNRDVPTGLSGTLGLSGLLGSPPPALAASSSGAACRRTRRWMSDSALISECGKRLATAWKHVAGLRMGE